MAQKEEFQKERERLNALVMEYGNRETKRFFSMDHQMYENGSLSEKTKELLGLVASLVLRCDDCVFYHLIRCQEVGVTDEEITEAMNIALFVGGSIVIPHFRRAIDRWNQLGVQNGFFSTLKKDIKQILQDSFSVQEKYFKICLTLKNGCDIYDWVGFYFINPLNSDELVLGAYMGEPTEHVRIPLGKGICGRAAKEESTFVIQDVTQEQNYLSCNAKVKSEIVIPIFKDGKIFGELDIDSHTIAAFTQPHKNFLEEVVRGIEKLY